MVLSSPQWALVVSAIELRLIIKATHAQVESISVVADIYFVSMIKEMDIVQLAWEVWLDFHSLVGNLAFISPCMVADALAALVVSHSVVKVAWRYAIGIVVDFFQAQLD